MARPKSRTPTAGGKPASAPARPPASAKDGRPEDVGPAEAAKRTASGEGREKRSSSGQGRAIAVAGENPAAPAVPGHHEIELEGKVESKAAGTITTTLLHGNHPHDDFPLDQLYKLSLSKENLAWVDLSEYGEADIRKVAELLKLHTVGVEATMASWQRPRVDAFDDHYFVSVTVATVNRPKHRIVATELDLFAGPNFLVSAHKTPLPFLEQVRERLLLSPELARYHTAYAVYIFLDELLEYYEGIFEHLEEDIERLEERALREESETFLEQLIAMKRHVFNLVRLVEQHRSVFAAFTRPDFPFVAGDDVEPYFKDLQEELSTVVDRLQAAKDSVNGAFEIYVSQVAHRTGQVIKLLTIVSTVLLPATVIISFFSTNFNFFGIRSLTSFFVMIGLLVVVPGGILLGLRLRRWI